MDSSQDGSVSRRSTGYNGHFGCTMRILIGQQL